MKIGVIGASGFIGKCFCELALEAGHEVVGYSRELRPSGRMEWRVFNKEVDFSGLHAIVNFAGESVAQRWTERKKKEFYESRVGVTEQVIDALTKLAPERRPQTLVNASAVGYYGDRGEEALTEDSSRGDGYLSDLCLVWEEAALAARDLGVRVVLGRIGIVLGKGGAAWEKMVTAFKLGLGGPLGGGEQWMPWVDVKDVAGGVLFSLENESVEGALNLVSPEPYKNKEFTQALGAHVQRPAFLPAPEFALRLAFGEFGKHLLDSYRVYPEGLQSGGYTFHSTTLEHYFRQN